MNNQNVSGLNNGNSLLNRTYSCSHSGDVDVELFKNHDEVLERILGGYSFADLANRPMPNGINQDKWRGYASGSNYERYGREWMNGDANTPFEDIFFRKNWIYMDDFRVEYDTIIFPLLQRLFSDFISRGDLPKEVFVYNDRELGNFSFDRASINLIPVFEFYDDSIPSSVENENVERKENKTFNKKNGNEIFWIPKYEDSVKSVRACKLKREGKPIYEIMEDAELKPKKFTSNVKKSFVYQEKRPMPKKAVRIFVDLMAGAGYDSDRLKWQGYAGVGLAKFLQAIGFEVSIVAMFGWINFTANLGQVYCFTAKEFGEPMNFNYLLYLLSDSAVLRLKGHLFHTLNSSDKNIEFQSYIFDENCTFFSVCRTYGVMDNLWNKNIMSFSLQDTNKFLYIKMPRCFSRDRMLEAIRNAVQDVLNVNLAASEQARQQAQNIP